VRAVVAFVKHDVEALHLVLLEPLDAYQSNYGSLKRKAPDRSGAFRRN